MFCTNCGKEIPNTSNFCKYCGNTANKVENEILQETVNSSAQSNTTVDPQYSQTNNNAGKTNPSAIAGFVCSLLGLLIAGIPMGIIAISLGVSAKKHIATFKNEKGKGLATAAIVIGIIDIVCVILGIILNAVSTAIL